MTTTASRQYPRGDPASSPGLRGHLAGAMRATSSGAATLIRRVPGTVGTARAGARDTTSALQTLPDPTLRSLAATSVGIGAGLRLAGAPRLAVAAAVASAMIVAAAIALRPTEPAVPMEVRP
jgi:hypothetical protein